MADHDQRGPGGAAQPPPPGDGAAKGTGYGAGGLGGGADRADGGHVSDYDAPGVTPGGRRTGSFDAETEEPDEAGDGRPDRRPAP